MTFIDRGKMDEKQLIAFYKKARRRVCLKLDEIEHTTNFGAKNYEKYKNSTQYKNFIKKHKKSKYNLTDTNFYNKNNRKQSANTVFLIDKDKQKKMNKLNMEAAYESLIKNMPQRKSHSYNSTKFR